MTEGTCIVYGKSAIPTCANAPTIVGTGTKSRSDLDPASRTRVDVLPRVFLLVPRVLLARSEHLQGRTELLRRASLQAARRARHPAQDAPSESPDEIAEFW